MNRKCLALLTLSLATGCMSGCVTRELEISSEPSGASVLINDTYRGTTPMTHKFTHYQVFVIRVEKEGYYPLEVEEKVAAPLYERPGLDFVSEVLVPKKIQDKRTLHYELDEIEEVDEIESVLTHAKETRESVAAAALKEQEKVRTHPPVPLPLKEGAKEAEERAAREAKALESQGPATGEEAIPTLESPALESTDREPAPGSTTPPSAPPQEK
ncbi:MAG: PEGA domain-containing protein [Planctomycetota bacterium]